MRDLLHVVGAGPDPVCAGPAGRVRDGRRRGGAWALVRSVSRVVAWTERLGGRRSDTDLLQRHPGDEAGRIAATGGGVLVGRRGGDVAACLVRGESAIPVMGL